MLDGDVTSATTFETWLRDGLTHGAGRSDAILPVVAYLAGDAEERAAIDDLALALSPSREQRMETKNQGNAFAANLTFAATRLVTLGQT